jgi:hypothetical protein
MSHTLRCLESETNTTETETLNAISSSSITSLLHTHLHCLTYYFLYLDIPQNQLICSLKKTLSYDPAKSETFKALQEAELGDSIQEVTVPAQTRVFSPSAQLKVTYLL